jgi:DUF4097 and DUF4098 domain-containing protein YvlB
MRHMRFRTATWGVIVGTLLAFSVAAHALEKEEFHRTYPLNADGVFALSNVNGEVQVRGWDQNSVQVDAVKTADDKEYLQETRIEVSASSSSITIDTKYPEHMHNHRGSTVDYTISIPKGARIRKLDLVNGTLTIEGVHGDITASTVNGRLGVEGSAGDLHLNSVNGQITAAVTQLGKYAKLSCVNGQLTLTVPSDVNVSVKGSTVNGNISNDFGMQVEHAKYGPGSSLSGQLGDGTSRLELSTVNGGIRLVRAGDGKTASKVTQKPRSGSNSSYY